MTGGLYVYAIASTGGLPEDLGAGIDDAPITAVVATENVAAIVHAHRSGPYQGADDDVRRWVLEHGSVVERLWDAGATVLPVSFNVIVTGAEHDGEQTGGDDEGQQHARARLVTWLTAQAGTLEQRLAALHGQAELRIEVALDVAAVSAEHPEASAARQEMHGRPEGIQRLLRKRLEQQERGLTDTLADELYPAIRRRLAAISGDLVENRSARSEPGTVPVLTVSVLVPAAEVHLVGQELAMIQAEQPAARIRFLGPWPPYSFSDAPALTDQGAEGGADTHASSY